MRARITALTRNGAWGYLAVVDEMGNETGGKEIFFHIANCSRNFRPEIGRVVEYELARAFRVGQPDQAVNLRYVDDAAQPVQTVAQTAQKGGNGVQS